MGQTNVRLWVAAMYDSDEWRRKVQNMPNRQVYAIYRRHCLGNPKSLPAPSKKKPKVPWPIFETTKQYTIFDY